MGKIIDVPINSIDQEIVGGMDQNGNVIMTFITKENKKIIGKETDDGIKHSERSV